MATTPQPTPISDLQHMLRIIFPKSPLSVDGIYGRETRNHVMRFQREHNLPVTGVADQDTYELIKEIYKLESVLFGQAEPLRIVLQPHQVLMPGSDNVHVYLVQAMLIVMRKYYRDMPPLVATGILDAQTEQAVKWFQKHAGLPVNGEINKVTWQHLVKQYRLIAGDGTGTFPIRIAKSEPPGGR